MAKESGCRLNSLPRSLALRVYGLVFETLTPVWRWWLKNRLHKGKETQTSLGQRWMQTPPMRPRGRLIWGHAVGVGEMMALVGLLKRIHELEPNVSFLVTTTARTSADALTKQHLGPAFTHWFAPVDTPSNASRFLDHWQPDLALWCEMDLWPALIDATLQRQTPCVLVNARLNQQSLKKRRWGRLLYAPLLGGFCSIWAQNKETVASLLALGAKQEKIKITGSIKAIVPPLFANPNDVASWLAIVQERPIWILASSHSGEESIALAAHQQLLLKHPNALLIIVPRDIKRGNEIAKLCGSGTPRRSLSEVLGKHNPYFVADTIGELGIWYRLSKVAMVGGSWTSIGGHNPYEATALGNMVIHGPNVCNFTESYADLTEQKKCVLAQSPNEIAMVVSHCWSQPPPESEYGSKGPQELDLCIQELLDFIPKTSSMRRLPHRSIGLDSVQ